MANRFVVLISIVTTFAALALWAADKHEGSHHGMNHGGNQLQEGGQATFAALIEMVQLLEESPETDWKNVDIDSLRLHLLDMHHLMLNTEADKTRISNTVIRFDVRGTAAAIPSIHRMATAHARFIEQSRGWKIQSEKSETGASVLITVDDSDTLDRLEALGFYGFMSLDSHHQAHHYQMALGNGH